MGPRQALIAKRGAALIAVVVAVTIFTSRLLERRGPRAPPLATSWPHNFALPPSWVRFGGFCSPRDSGVFSHHVHAETRTIVFTTLSCSSVDYCLTYVPMWLGTLRENMPDVEPLVVSPDYASVAILQAMGVSAVLHWLEWESPRGVDVYDYRRRLYRGDERNFKWLYMHRMLGCGFRALFLDVDLVFVPRREHFLTAAWARRRPADILALLDANWPELEDGVDYSGLAERCRTGATLKRRGYDDIANVDRLSSGVVLANASAAAFDIVDALVRQLASSDGWEQHMFNLVADSFAPRARIGFFDPFGEVTNIVFARDAPTALAASVTPALWHTGFMHREEKSEALLSLCPIRPTDAQVNAARAAAARSRSG